jgi:hypothetical protein
MAATYRISIWDCEAQSWDARAGRLSRGDLRRQWAALRREGWTSVSLLIERDDRAYWRAFRRRMKRLGAK